MQWEGTYEQIIGGPELPMLLSLLMKQWSAWGSHGPGTFYL